MFRDAFGTIIKEFQDETNQNHLQTILGPVSAKVKTAYFIILALMLIITGSMIYSNIVLYNIVKKLGASQLSQTQII